MDYVADITASIVQEECFFWSTLQAFKADFVIPLSDTSAQNPILVESEYNTLFEPFDDLCKLSSRIYRDLQTKPVDDVASIYAGALLDEGGLALLECYALRHHNRVAPFIRNLLQGLPQLTEESIASPVRQSRFLGFARRKPPLRHPQARLLVFLRDMCEYDLCGHAKAFSSAEASHSVDFGSTCELSKSFHPTPSSSFAAAADALEAAAPSVPTPHSGQGPGSLAAPADLTEGIARGIAALARYLSAPLCRLASYRKLFVMASEMEHARCGDRPSRTSRNPHTLAAEQQSHGTEASRGPPPLDLFVENGDVVPDVIPAPLSATDAASGLPAPVPHPVPSDDSSSTASPNGRASPQQDAMEGPPPCSSACEAYRRLAAAVSQALDRVSRLIKATIISKSLETAAAKVLNPPSNLDLKAQRSVLFDGSLLKAYSRGLHKRHFFLFDGCLVYTTPTGIYKGHLVLNVDPLPSVTWVDPPLGHTADDGFKDVHLAVMEAGAGSVPAEQLYGFVIQSRHHKLLTLYATSLPACSYWISLLEGALVNIQASRQARSAQLKALSNPYAALVSVTAKMPPQTASTSILQPPKTPPLTSKTVPPITPLALSTAATVPIPVTPAAATSLAGGSPPMSRTEPRDKAPATPAAPQGVGLSLSKGLLRPIPVRSYEPISDETLAAIVSSALGFTQPYSISTRDNAREAASRSFR